MTVVHWDNLGFSFNCYFNNFANVELGRKKCRGEAFPNHLHHSPIPAHSVSQLIQKPFNPTKNPHSLFRPKNRINLVLWSAGYSFSALLSKFSHDSDLPLITFFVTHIYSFNDDPYHDQDGLYRRTRPILHHWQWWRHSSLPCASNKCRPAAALLPSSSFKDRRALHIVDWTGEGRTKLSNGSYRMRSAQKLSYEVTMMTVEDV